MDLLRKKILDRQKNNQVEKKEHIEALIQLIELLLTQNASEEAGKYISELLLLVEEGTESNLQNNIDIYEVVAKYYQQKKAYSQAYSYLEKAFQLTKKQNSVAHLQQQIQATNQQTNKRISVVSNIIAHNFNTHLSHIEGVMEGLQFNDKLILDDEANECLQIIEQSVIKLRNKLKIMTIYGASAVVDTPIKLLDLNHVLLVVKSRLDQKIMDTNAKIIVDKLPQISAHFKPIRQLFQELIDNALKFRKIDQTPLINIKYFSENKYENAHHFAICDNGIGVDQKYQDDIFLPYKQLVIPEEKNRGNLGVGLSICKKIIKSYDGNIWFESEIGKGTCFHFTIPKF